MKQQTKYSDLLSKYAILLAIGYFLEIILARVIRMVDTESLARAQVLIMTNIPFAFSLLLNIVIAVFIEMDRRKLKVETNYVILATILYRPVGVIAFLLFTLYRYRNDSEVV